MELSKYGVDVILFNPGDHPGETPLCFGQSANYEVSVYYGMMRDKGSMF